jgi:hypothetical protein
MWRLQLKPLLEHHRISAYQLARATAGKLSESTVYSLSRAPQKRIDLDSLQVVAVALQQIIGQPVTLDDLIKDLPTNEPNMNTKYAQLFKNAKPVTREHQERVWTTWTPEELEADEAYWNARAQEKGKVRDRVSNRRRDEEF